MLRGCVVFRTYDRSHDFINTFTLLDVGIVDQTGEQGPHKFFEDSS